MTVTIQTNPNPEHCTNCDSTAVVKFGTYKGVQRYWCKACKRKFKADGTLFHMKTPANQVSSALSMYYEGMSIKAIKRQLQQDHDNSPSTATIFEWVGKYTPVAANATRDYQPKVGDTWIADETFIRVDKHKKGDADVANPYTKSKKAKWIVFWDIIDADTRFLLASHITTTRGTKDAQSLMEKASKRAGKLPKVVVTDKLRAYLDGIELAYGADAQHRQGAPFDIENNTNLIERFHGTLKARTKVMRALRNRDSAENFSDGWLVHYNFLRPHESLNDRTPAEVAGLSYPFKNWKDVTQLPLPRVRLTECQPKAMVASVTPVISRRVPRLTRRTPRITPKRPHVQDLGAGIIRDRRGQHLRLS